MKDIQQGQQHVIIAARADGAIGLFYAREPLNWLAALGTHAVLEDVEVRPGEAAAKVIEALRGKFQAAHFPGLALPWYLIDYRQAINALNEFDLDTGERARVAIDTEVMVLPDRNRGSVMGYTRGGQIVVRLHASRNVANVVIAPTAMVKPVIRMPAIAVPLQ